ncbi:DUF6883 domain-containing protein [Methylobacterium trifolii]|uniref:DUF6883 domain-containing protein n=1 Tax=Methylobacterium trifolii TaxID=1003092 RepID=UPI0035A24EDE
MTPYISWPAGFVIHPRKITHYLLTPASRDGRPKARFFENHGFVAPPPDGLAQALIAHTSLETDVGNLVVPRGHKLIFEGPIPTPTGPSPRVRSVWMVDSGGTGVARLVTAYPFGAAWRQLKSPGLAGQGSSSSACERVRRGRPAGRPRWRSPGPLPSRCPRRARSGRSP